MTGARLAGPSRVVVGDGGCFASCDWGTVAAAYRPPAQRLTIMDPSLTPPRERALVLRGHTAAERRNEAVRACSAAGIEPAAHCGDVADAVRASSEREHAALLRAVASAASDNVPVRVNVGAHTDTYTGWVSASADALDVTDSRSFAAVAAAAGGSVAGLLAEHVWEHLTPIEALVATANAAAALARGAAIRLAVPDGWRPEFWGGAGVVGGSGGRGDHVAAPIAREVAYGHAMVHTVGCARGPALGTCSAPCLADEPPARSSIAALLAAVRLVPLPLEWHTQSGEARLRRCAVRECVRGRA